MARPRTLCLIEPESPPKRHCCRGHALRKAGWTLHRFQGRNGDWYTARRCRACLLEDVQSCKAKKAKRLSRLAA